MAKRAVAHTGKGGARPAWKGALKLSLITIPIRVFPATGTADVQFRQLHRKCHTPIELKKWCPHCHEEVTPDALVKGHEVSRGRFAIVEDEDIARLRPDSTHVVDVAYVADAAVIDPVYIERAYVLAPDTQAAGSAFAVIRDALAGRAAIGRLALHGREYLVAVVQHEAALMLYTVRTKGEVRDVQAMDGLAFAHARPKPEEIRLARQVLDSLEVVTDLTSFTDHYEDALRAMLARKGTADVAVTKERAKPVANLMDALRRSLADVQGDRHATGRGASTQRARLLRHPAHGHRQRRKAS